MIILVAGLPGSGKSYFAEKLALKLGAVYLNSDRTRKSMDAMGRYGFEDKLAVYKEMVRLSHEALEAGRGVVADATFYHHSMRDLFQELAKQHSCPICLVLVHAEEALIRKRLSAPRSDSEADFKVYRYVRDQFEEITSAYLNLESTNDNLDDMLSKAIAYIRNCHEAA